MRRKKETSSRIEESHASTCFDARLSLSTFVLRRELIKVWIYVSCILLLTTAFTTEDMATEISRSGGKTSSTAHSCYVCLSPEKSSAEEKEALSLSFHETRQQIPDSATFAFNCSTDFIRPCPSKHVGCLIRIHGANESRLCAHFSLNDCNKAYKMEHCHCIICNVKRPHYSRSTTESERESRKVWWSGETDDEDLLPKPNHHLGKIQDDGVDVGSGEWEAPPGVILLDTTTPKPTLIANLRPDSRTTTPISTSGVQNFTRSVDLWLVFSVLSVAVLLYNK